MHTERNQVVTALRRKGDHDRALQAACVLPRDIDTATDSGRAALHNLGVDPDTLELPVVEPDGLA